MPGIAGHIGRGNADLGAMTGCMAHEPFYATGTLSLKEAGVNVGWVALADTSGAGMPVWNEARDVGLVLSGELYGMSAQDVVRSCEQNGSAHIPPLNGIFSGVLIDLRVRKAVLFNDRYGLERLYYYENEQGLFFASEAKALLKVLPRLREVDPAGLGEFVSCGCVLENRTLFKDVRILPGASRWTFVAGAPTKRERYFDFADWESAPVLKADEYRASLVETFSRALPRYLDGQLPVAISLTGGLDSRMMLAWARRNMPAYTFAGPYRDCADVQIARQIARISGLPHATIGVSEDFLQNFSALAEKTVRISDGTMDVSGAVELYVNRRAREVAPVRLTGNYGSEILRSNVAFRPGRLRTDFLAPELARHVEVAREVYGRQTKGHRLSFIAFKQVPWHHYARRSIESSQLTPRSPFLDNDLVALAYRRPPEFAASPEPLMGLIARGNPALASIGSDRAGNWQRFTAKAEYAFDYGMPDWLAKLVRVLAPLKTERLFLGRHKFYHFRVWYRDQLSTYVKAVLLDSKTLGRPYWKRAELERLVLDHVAGRRNRTLELHKLLSIELMHRTLIEPN